MQPLNITLTFAKSTKGTHVYIMKLDGKDMGSVYLPKLVLPAEPPADLHMLVKVPG